MIITLYLILGHLLGDFVLQSNKLFSWKMKSFKGVLAHVSVHFLITNLLLLPIYLAATYWPLAITLVISLTHFALDQLKVNHDNHHPHSDRLKPFLLDQFFHFLTIAAFYPLIQSQDIFIPDHFFNRLYTTPEIPLFLSLGIISTFAYDILRFQLVRNKKPKAKLSFSVEKWHLRLLFMFALLVLSTILQF